MPSRSNSSGFTLLELLIVIVVIGILAVLIIPNLASGPQRARDSRRKSGINSVAKALELYFHDKSGYPNATYSQLKSILSPAYIGSLPIDPKTAADYDYIPLTLTSSFCSSGATCAKFQLRASLESNSDSSITTCSAIAGSSYGIVPNCFKTNSTN